MDSNIEKLNFEFVKQIQNEKYLAYKSSADISISDNLYELCCSIQRNLADSENIDRIQLNNSVGNIRDALELFANFVFINFIPTDVRADRIDLKAKLEHDDFTKLMRIAKDDTRLNALRQITNDTKHQGLYNLPTDVLRLTVPSLVNAFYDVLKSFCNRIDDESFVQEANKLLRNYVITGKIIFDVGKDKWNNTVVRARIEKPNFPISASKREWINTLSGKVIPSFNLKIDNRDIGKTYECIVSLADGGSSIREKITITSDMLTANVCSNSDEHDDTDLLPATDLDKQCILPDDVEETAQADIVSQDKRLEYVETPVVISPEVLKRGNTDRKRNDRVSGKPKPQIYEKSTADKVQDVRIQEGKGKSISNSKKVSVKPVVSSKTDKAENTISNRSAGSGRPAGYNEKSEKRVNNTTPTTSRNSFPKWSLYGIALILIAVCVFLVDPFALRKNTNEDIPHNTSKTTEDLSFAQSVNNGDFDQILVSYYGIYCLTLDGGVKFYPSINNTTPEKAYSEWNDIKKLYINPEYPYLYALRNDGTVCSDCDDLDVQNEIKGLKNVKDLSLYGIEFVCLHNDGTVTSVPLNPNQNLDEDGNFAESLSTLANCEKISTFWGGEKIIEGSGFVSARRINVFGISATGTIVCNYDLDQMPFHDVAGKTWKDWTGITDILILERSGELICLTENGELKYAGRLETGVGGVYFTKEIIDENVTQISAGTSHIIALKDDGTVIAKGDNYYGQCEVDEWKDIIKIEASGNTSIGYAQDGKIFIAGYNPLE